MRERLKASFRVGTTPSIVHAGAAASLALASFALACGCAGGDGGQRGGPSEQEVSRASSAIVGGTISPVDEDFIVFLGHKSESSFACGATVVAPNLLLTAKHCVFDYDKSSTTICDATGEPQAGSTGSGGYVTSPVPLTEIVIYRGGDGRKRFAEGGAPDAQPIKVIDDETPTLCSHDLAYLVLDRPLTVPVAKLRLGKRPESNASVNLAGWGLIEDRLRTNIRFSRSGILIQRVGPPVPPQFPEGSLGPRTFETGPGGCTGDSGSPAYDPQTGAVLGLLARALSLDPSHPISPCLPATVQNVYMTVADFGKPLRNAFSAASAEPSLEGRPAAGFLRFGDACFGDLECGDGLCKGASAEATSAGTCNVACKTGGTCPSGYVCGASGTCEGAAVATDAGTNPQPTSPNVDAGFSASGGCSVGRTATRADACSFASVSLFGASALLVLRSRMKRRR